jgi:hypothetical protein
MFISDYTSDSSELGKKYVELLPALVIPFSGAGPGKNKAQVALG